MININKNKPITKIQPTKRYTNLLDTEINVLLNTKTKAASVTEVASQKLVFLNLQATFQELHCLVTPNSDIARNLFVTPNAKRSHSVPCCTNQNKTLYTSI
ncbi:hypothetical protein HanRHA438_Chr04g0184131 [Helianthus annuus]|nr:hypothetical protein HanRHA438_Chr04g0184131 [Helianthus annuus]